MTEQFTVSVPGGEIAGEQRDAPGEPLVLIHGMGGSRASWDRLVAALPAHLPLLRYDLRGFGQSTGEDGVAFSHADDLLALLDARGIERATLVGLSLGGGVALNFALSHPERLARLVLVSPAMVGWEWSDAWKALWRGVASAARSGHMELARERWAAHPMFAKLDAAATAEFRAELATYPGRQWLRDDQRPELPDVDRLHTLAMPTLLLSGASDVPDMRLIADVIAAAAPGVTRIDYTGAGHMLHVERTAEVAGAIAGFVGV